MKQRRSRSGIMPISLRPTPANIKLSPSIRSPLKNESADELSLQIENQVVKSSDKLTIFGVTIDDKLTFSYHIKDISKRASQKVGVLLRLRNLIPCSAKLQLYKSAILPHLTYCDTVWHFCKSSDRCKLERIQERALRAVFKSKTESSSDLLKRASLPTLLQRRLQKIATLMFKVKNGLVPHYLSAAISDNF